MRVALAVCLLVAAQAPAPAPSPQTIKAHFTPHDRQTGRYQYLPFDVPADAGTLTISYRYSGDKEGTSVVDLGLFEPGPLTLGTPAFRGYSGGALRTITVGPTGSSAAYRDGALPAGRWHVMLGLYKVAPEGVDVEVDVSVSHAAAPRWYTGALHLHTVHSDGALAPAAVADLARSAGLDFIAITDHNNTVWRREPMPSSPVAILGEEVTTPAGHANVWGLPRDAWIDFRIGPQQPGAAAAVDAFVAQAHRYGALFSINHPVGDCAGCAWAHVLPPGLDAFEIWNGERGPQEGAIAIWDRLLREGRRVTAVGASDWHRPPAAIQSAAVRVRVTGPLTDRTIVDAIGRGRVVVVRDTTIGAIEVSARCGTQAASVGDQLTCTRGEQIAVAVDAGAPAKTVDLLVNGSVAAGRPLAHGTSFTVSAVAGTMRLHLRDQAGAIVAVTNPIYVAAR